MKRGPKPFITKVCPACRIEKPRSEFYRKLTSISRFCKPCSLADSRTRAPKYFGKYLKRANDWRRNRYTTDPAYRKKIQLQKAVTYLRRKESLNAARRLRWATDPDNPARKHSRWHDMKLCTPSWVDKQAIADFYFNCPDGMEVDHIIPRKGLIDGRKVCGLHVLWNLQYLPVELNRKKYNRVSERDIHAQSSDDVTYLCRTS